MRVGFVTVGDTGRLTGGYLYNARVLAGLRREEIEVEELVASGASPAEQEEATSRLGSLVDPRRFDVIVVDALARIVCAPHLDRWREVCPVVAMVHELPSVALPGTTIARSNREPEKPLLRAERLIAVSDHGSSILQKRGVPAERIHVVPPGFDRLSSANADAEPAASDGASVRALCVAQWIPRKGILDLVRAWTARERTGAMLELIGEADADPAYAASVRAAIEDAPGASITVSGPVDDAALEAAYAVADLFVLPSRYEGYDRRARTRPADYSLRRGADPRAGRCGGRYPGAGGRHPGALRSPGSPARKHRLAKPDVCRRPPPGGPSAALGGHRCRLSAGP